MVACSYLLTPPQSFTPNLPALFSAWSFSNFDCLHRSHRHRNWLSLASGCRLMMPGQENTLYNRIFLFRLLLTLLVHVPYLLHPKSICWPGYLSKVQIFRHAIRHTQCTNTSSVHHTLFLSQSFMLLMYSFKLFCLSKSKVLSYVFDISRHCKACLFPCWLLASWPTNETKSNKVRPS